MSTELPSLGGRADTLYLNVSELLQHQVLKRGGTSLQVFVKSQPEKIKNWFSHGIAY